MATSAATTKNAKLFAINNLAFGLQSTSRLERRGQLPNTDDFPEENEDSQEGAAKAGAAVESPARSNSLPASDLAYGSILTGVTGSPSRGASCPLCLASARPYGDEVDEALLRLVERWDKLPSHIRSAIQTLLDAAGSSIDGAECGGGAS